LVNFSLGAVKIGPENFARLAEQAMDTPWVPHNPRPIAGPAQVREILELAPRTPHPPGAALGSAIADALEILPLAVIEQGGTGGRGIRFTNWTVRIHLSPPASPLRTYAGVPRRDEGFSPIRGIPG